MAASVGEAELIAMKEAILQVRWTRALLEGLGEKQTGPTPLYSDSKTALDMVTHFGLSRTTRHACVTLAVVREAVADGTVQLLKVSTDNNVADLFTKALPGPRTRQLSALLNLVEV